MIEMTIDSIRVSLMNYQHVVILKEKKSDRYLPIWIGPAEADAISIKLQNVDLARPMTHDLLRNAILALEAASGTAVSRIVVNDLRADTFYAQIIFEPVDSPSPVDVRLPHEGSHHRGYEGELTAYIVWQSKEYKGKIINRWQEKNHHFLEIATEHGLIFEVCSRKDSKEWLLSKIKLDSRPSDAIALAVRATVPIYVEESVLDKAGIFLDRETGKPIPADKITEGERDKLEDRGKVDEQELKKLSAFYDFINTLDLDDLGKRKS